MAIMVVAAGVVPKFGAASLVGLTSGLLAAFLGLGDFGALDTFVSYTMVGVGADLALLLLRNPENLVVAALVGTFGHFAKFLVKWAFGAIGGLLGGLTLVALRKAGFFAYLAEKR
jgi:ABC-type thiamin/hydroxymethylpyrimidine transport system permease subunit